MKQYIVSGMVLILSSSFIELPADEPVQNVEVTEKRAGGKVPVWDGSDYLLALNESITMVVARVDGAIQISLKDSSGRTILVSCDQKLSSIMHLLDEEDCTVARLDRNADGFVEMEVVTSVKPGASSRWMIKHERKEVKSD